MQDRFSTVSGSVRTVVESLALAAVLTAAACGGAADGVHSPREAIVVTAEEADRPLDWHFSTVWTLGAHDSDAVLFDDLDARHVAVTGEGTTYVLDDARRRVLGFGAGGALVTTLGRPAASGRAGTAAGDLAEPVAIGAAADGTVGVFDSRYGGIVRWRADGERLPLIRVRSDYQGGPLALLDPAAAAFAVRAAAGVGEQEDQLVVYTEGGPAATLARVRRPPPRIAEVAECGARLVPLTPVFTQPLVWAEAGGRLVYSDRADYAIEIMERGRHVLSVRRAIEPERATPALAFQEVGDSVHMPGDPPCTVTGADAVAARGIARLVPAVLRLAVSPAGELWVLRRAAETGPRIDVFDRDGRYLGTLPPGSPFPVAFPAVDRIAAVEHTDDGVPYLAVYDVIR
jgi:hypothetical protein